jgi:sugar phosphate isomerase/epimerase
MVGKLLVTETIEIARVFSRRGRFMLTLATKFSPVRASFEEALQSGFQATEFWLDANWLSRHTEIAAIAQDFPFRYALHFPNHGPLTAEHLQATVDLYRCLNATAIIIHQPMFDRYAGALLELDRGLDLAIENHVLDLEGFEQWAEKSPGLTLDVEHLWMFTLRDAPFSTLLQHVDRFLTRYSKKLQHVHLPGYRPGDPEHQPIHFNEELGNEILNRLAAHGFSKLVVSELDSPFQKREFLERDVQFFQRWKQSLS